MSLQFLATLNQTYITIHSLVEKGTVYETKFLKAIDELKKNEELRKKLVKEVKAARGAKATLEEELAKTKAENNCREVRKTSKLSNVTMPPCVVRLWVWRKKLRQLRRDSARPLNKRPPSGKPLFWRPSSGL